MFNKNNKIMARINNQVMLIGNLGADPIIKTFANGQRMARLSIATQIRRHSLNGKEEKMVKWHQLVAWGGTADIIRNMLKKGRRVAIEGRLNQHTWHDENGQTHKKTEVVIQDFTLIQ